MSKTLRKMLKISIVTLILLSQSPTTAKSEGIEPQLFLSEDKSGVKVDWAVEMSASDVLWETGFEEGDESISFNYNMADSDPPNRQNGGQSFVTSEKYSGNRSLQIKDSYSNGNYKSRDFERNWVYSPATSTIFDKRRYVENGANLSFSFRVKTNGDASVNLIGQGGRASYGEPVEGTVFLEDVNVGDRTARISDLSFIIDIIDKEGGVPYLANMKGNYTSHMTVTSYDTKTNTITLDRGFGGPFKKGDTVLKHNYRRPVNFAARKISKNISDDWVLVNSNTKVRDNADYDTAVRGFALWIQTTTHDTVWIDDLKMGYAPRVKLNRDGNEIYDGYLSQYEDKSATDKEPPESVGGINVAYKDGKANLTWNEAEDKGSIYTYRVDALDRQGNVDRVSEEKPIEIKSGIKGYSILTDNNPTSVPNDTINTTGTSFNLGEITNENNYVHIKAIDNAGNSSVTHFKIEDTQAPKLTLTPNTKELTNENIRVDVDAQDAYSGIKRVFVVSDNILENGDFSEGYTHWRSNEDRYPGEYGQYEIKDGILSLKDNTPKRNRVYQSNILDKTVVGSKYYAEITARGVGVLNTRFGLSSGTYHSDYKQTLRSDSEFQVYSFILERFENNNNNLAVERIGPGSVEISDIKLFSEMDIADGYFEVEENGKYTVIVEDNAGNISTESIVIDNIYRELPKIEVIGDFDSWVRNSLVLRVTGESEIGRVTITDPTGNKHERDRLDYTVFDNGDYEFSIEDPAGNIVKKIVEVRNIDLIDPIINITSSESGWIRELMLTISAEDNESGVKSVSLLSGQPSKNMLNNSDILDSSKVYGSAPIDFINNDGVITFKNGEDFYSGVSIPYLRSFEENESYVLSFDMTKTSGDIEYIGGHLKFSENTKVYIDGVEMTEQYKENEVNTWSGSVPYPNDDKKHHIEVQFNTDDAQHSLDKSIAIQPNRVYEVLDFTVKLENVQIEKGERSTPFVRNQEGLGGNPLEMKVTENGEYTFEAIDNVGNVTTETINISNIDNISPIVNLTQENTEWTNDSVSIKVEAIDNESGVENVYVIGDGEIVAGEVGALSAKYGSPSEQVQSSQNQMELKGDSFDVLDNGVYKVIVEDKVGNVATKPIEITNIDKIKPSIDISQDIHEQTTDNIELTVSATDNDSGVKRIQNPQGEWINSPEIIYEVDDNGEYVFKVEDNAGNITVEAYIVENLIRTRAFEPPIVEPFLTKTIPNESTKYLSKMSDLNVYDWTLNKEEWRVMVSSTPLTHKNGKDVMSTGSVTLRELDSIDHPNGLVASNIDKVQAIDKGQVMLLQGYDTFGKITAKFKQEGLGITIDPSTVKTGSYSTTITWSLVVAP